MKHKNGLVVVIGKILKRNKIFMFGFFLSIAGAIFFTVLPPLVLEQIVNQITNGNSKVVIIAVVYFLTLVMAGVFEAIKEVMITIFGQKVTRGLRHEMCEKLTHLKASYFVNNETGKITSRFVNDVDTVESLFSNGIISMFVDGCKVISIIFIIWTKSTGLGVLVLIATPLLAVLTRVFQKRMLKAQLQNRVAIEKVNNHVPETIQNIRMIHSFHKEKYMEHRYEKMIRESYRAVEKSNRYDSIYSPIIIVSSAVLVAVMMVLSATGGVMRTFFGMSVGTAVAMIAYVGKVFDPLEAIGMEIQNIQSAVAGVRRMNEFLGEEEKKTTDAAITADALFKGKEKGILFDDVSFGYEEGKLILEGVSFQIKEGEQVTFIGRTGVGKSTIFRLLLGLYEPCNGSVKIFGYEAERIPEAEKRKLFGYVEQSFTPVQGTVKDQITLFDDQISDLEVERAARRVGIYDKIKTLEKGFDTPFKTQQFSQGQMQLLSIARALVKNPMILLFDEMTANLDSETEQQIMSALQNASKDKTVISISHRLVEQGKTRLIEIS